MTTRNLVLALAQSLADLTRAQQRRIPTAPIAHRVKGLRAELRKRADARAEIGAAGYTPDALGM